VPSRIYYAKLPFTAHKKNAIPNRQSTVPGQVTSNRTRPRVLLFRREPIVAVSLVIRHRTSNNRRRLLSAIVVGPSATERDRVGSEIPIRITGRRPVITSRFRRAVNSVSFQWVTGGGRPPTLVVFGFVRVRRAYCHVRATSFP